VSDELDLVAVPGGTLLKIRVKAKARENASRGVHAGRLRIHVTAVPERGKANRAVIEVLAGRLRLAASALKIVAGATTSDKTILVPLEPAVVAARLSLHSAAAYSRASRPDGPGRPRR
jgi:hypothetical protein